MTRLQLLGVALLSVLATAGVLVGAVGATPDFGDLTQRVQLAGAAAPAEDATTTAADDAAASTDASSSSDEATDTAAADTAATATDDAAATAADETATGDETTPTTDTTPASDTTTPTAAADATAPTRIGHLFVITLQGRGLEAAFGPGSAAPYLATELRPKGTLLRGYTSLGASALADRIALVSGQAPNASTQAECTTYKDIPPATKPDANGEVTADGCVYPNSITTFADQVTGAGKPWRAYVQDMEKGPRGDITCRRPQPGSADDTAQDRPGDGYGIRLNPFVFFRSLIDLSDCDANAGSLAKLPADLAAPAAKTPVFSWIAPSLCDSGTATPCANGSPGGLAAADAFLQTWVPKILASKAYQEDGLLAIVFAGGSGAEPAGALLLSRYVKPGGTDETKIDPYGLLRTFQDLLGYKPLARSKTATSLVPTVLATARIIQPGDD